MSIINLCSFLTTLPSHTQLPLQSTTSPPDSSTTQQCASHGIHLLSAKPEASSLTIPSHYPQCPYLKRRELVSSLEQYQPLKCNRLWWLTWNQSSCHYITVARQHQHWTRNSKSTCLYSIYKTLLLCFSAITVGEYS